MISDKIDELNKEINRQTMQRDRYIKLMGRFEDDELVILKAVYVYSYSIEFYFQKGTDRTAQRSLVMKLAKLLGKGSKAENKGSLYVYWSMTNEGNELGCSVYVFNYIPPTCRVVKQTRVILGEPAKPERVEEYESVVCTEGEDEEEDEGEAKDPGAALSY
jgi:hypothetical protein